MSVTAKRRNWNKVEQKRDAIIAVLEYLQSASEDERNDCVEDDDSVRELFEDPKVGNIDVPKGIKTVVMPMKERQKKAKGSVVLELPPPVGGKPAAGKLPNPLLVHLLCCYKVW
jgi:hypothetical protein